MTFREKLQQEHPNSVNGFVDGGCVGCPHDYGYEAEGACLAISRDARINNEACTECWDREIPEAEPNKAPKKAVYIAGPITGVKDYRQKFKRAEDELIKNGYIPLNPARNPYGLTNEQYMLMNVAAITAASAVLFLPDWQNSEGAALERLYARYIKKPVAESIEELKKVLDNG